MLVNLDKQELERLLDLIDKPDGYHLNAKIADKLKFALKKIQRNGNPPISKLWSTFMKSSG